MKKDSRELIWISAGAITLVVLFVTTVYFRADHDPAAQIAFKAKRAELVSAMRIALAAASEAQNSAVMSTAEQDSQTFADQAQSATAAVERGRADLEELLKLHGDQHELELMDRVSQTLREFRRIDKQLFEVAIQDSNHKAYVLAFGPATKALQEIDAALARLIAEHVNSNSEHRIEVLQLASDARIGVLRIQVALLPHIAEESDQKMDEFEAQIEAEDGQVREKLAALGARLPASDKSDIATATSRYADFKELTSRIIKLSRDNTDVRSVAMALNEKRKAMLDCQDALAALEHAIQAEPITTTIPKGR